MFSTAFTTYRQRIPVLITSLLLIVAVATGVSPALAASGHVLPATAQPHGYSLTDAARATAAFNVLSLRTQPDLYLQHLPFQMLYTPDFTTDHATFTVRPGTMLYVPVFFSDDTPAILGDFPTDPSQTAAYFFSQKELGCQDMTITVDGLTTQIGPSYVAGPVYLDYLPDGSGHNYVVLGAFISPLSKGTHTVTIAGTLVGQAVAPGFSFTTSYTVVVR